MTLESVIDRILEREGSTFTDDPVDRGGPTKYGITLKTLSRWRGLPVTSADVRDLTEAEARDIYRSLYIDKPGFDALVWDGDTRVAETVIDTGVNIGPNRSAMFLQRCLRDLEPPYTLTVDGDLGPVTMAVYRRYLAHRGEHGTTVLVEALRALRVHYYLALAEHDTTQRRFRFLYGWISRAVSA